MPVRENTTAENNTAAGLVIAGVAALVAASTLIFAAERTGQFKHGTQNSAVPVTLSPEYVQATEAYFNADPRQAWTPATSFACPCHGVSAALLRVFLSVRHKSPPRHMRRPLLRQLSSTRSLRGTAAVSSADYWAQTVSSEAPRPDGKGGCE